MFTSLYFNFNFFWLLRFFVFEKKQTGREGRGGEQASLLYLLTYLFLTVCVCVCVYFYAGRVESGRAGFFVRG